MRPRRALASIALAALATPALSMPALAQETTHGGVPTDDLAERRSDAIVDPRMSRSWDEGQARTFAAATIDAGYVYLRPRGTIGFGRPFRTFLGLDANPILVSGGLGGYGGSRFQIPYADLRVGVRYFSTFNRAYLTPKETYDRLDLDRLDRSKARYYTLEAELSFAIPAGPGDVIGLASASYVEGVPSDAYVFEETLRVITAPPLVWRGRGGYAYRFGSRSQHSIGLVADVLHVPRRDDSLTIRSGPVLRLALSRHFELRGSFVTTLSSPDRLGLVGGDFTELGVRYRIATE